LRRHTTITLLSRRFPLYFNISASVGSIALAEMR